MNVGRCCLAWIALILSSLVMPLRAHQLGVDNVNLQEFEGNQYRLSYMASPGSAEAQGRPILPQGSQWNEESEGAGSGTIGLNFTSGDRPLSSEDKILLPWKRNGVLFTVYWKNGTQARQFFMSGGEGILIDMGMLKAGSGNSFQTAKRYVLLGVGHILRGFDHLLFVLGLLLLVKGTRRLVLTITAFTLAHSVTLAMSVLGQLRLPTGLVDTIVAMSIVFLAVENVYAWRGRETLAAKKPWLVSFGFGLVHGLGFAGALNSLGLPTAEIPSALLFFNCGVEIGQLIFVAAWFSLAGALKLLQVRIPRGVRIGTIYALGILSSCWFLDRTIAMFH
ncbi:MAG: HupE/UreJ family protein [Luteolibacter sp.]